MITCAITGSTGILGKKIRKLLPYKFYEFKDDLRKKKKVERWVSNKDFDIIIHLAALVPVNEVNKNYNKAYDINVAGTSNLINSILKKKINQNGFFFHQHLMFINLVKNILELARILKQNHKINMEKQNFWQKIC